MLKCCGIDNSCCCCCCLSLWVVMVVYDGGDWSWLDGCDCGNGDCGCNDDDGGDGFYDGDWWWLAAMTSPASKGKLVTSL